MNRLIHTYLFVVNDLLIFKESSFHIFLLDFILVCLLIAICLLEYISPLCMMLVMSLLTFTGVLRRVRMS